MSDDALIDAILAAPDDDAPRLVYADVLSERGDPSGELIIVQCARARLHRAGERGTAEDVQLFQRERNLEETALLALKSRIESAHVTLERGFIKLAELTPSSLHRRWPFLVRQPIETMSFGVVTIADLALAATHPTVKTIEIGCSHPDNESKAILDARVLREANLASDADGDAAVWAEDELPDEPLLASIVALDLTSPTSGVFADLVALPRVAALGLDGPNDLTEYDAMHVSELATVTRLRADHWDPSAIEALLDAEPPPNLRNLSATGHQDQTIAGIAALPQLTALRTNFQLADFDAFDARATSLRTLFVEAKPRGGFDHLLRLDVVRRLEHLRLRGVGYPPVYGDSPPSFPSLARLGELELYGFTVEADVAHRFVAELEHVRVLDVRQSKISDEARAVLEARWPLGRYGRD